MDEQQLRSIWRAFGSYIAKQLVNGKGVIIPRFGSFTFTAAEVNLAVSTLYPSYSVFLLFHSCD